MGIIPGVVGHQLGCRRSQGRAADIRMSAANGSRPAAQCFGEAAVVVVGLAEVGDRRLYDGSRHTAGTILNELGVDMPTIMEILRHTQISQTRRYVKGRSHLSKDAMRRMGEFFVPPQEAPAEASTETTIETADTRAARSRRRRRVR